MLLNRVFWILKNEVFTHVIDYKPEYNNGILVTYAWVKNDVCYTHSASIVRPLPDKKLDVAWKTFRNRLTPGQKEEWTLIISKDKRRLQGLKSSQLCTINR